MNAICIYDDEQEHYIIEKVKEKLTNNKLEYRALIKAVNYAVNRYGVAAGYDFCGDSELIIKQMNGEYVVRKPSLRALRGDISRGLVGVKGIIHFTWVPRDKNKAGVVLEHAQLLTRRNLYE